MGFLSTKISFLEFFKSTNQHCWKATTIISRFPILFFRVTIQIIKSNEIQQSKSTDPDTISENINFFSIFQVSPQFRTLYNETSAYLATSLGSLPGPLDSATVEWRKSSLVNWQEVKTGWLRVNLFRHRLSSPVILTAFSGAFSARTAIASGYTRRSMWRIEKRGKS